MAEMNEKQERKWAMLCHLGGLSGDIVPLNNIVVPLIIWWIKKKESAFVENQGKEALNFQISITIYIIVSIILISILIGFILIPALAIFHLIMVTVASRKAYKGEEFHYPLTIRFIK